VAELEFEEEIRSDAVEEFHALEAAGYETHLLSGDDPVHVARVAAALGLRTDRVRGGLTPEAKAALVRELDDADTLMVGDGVNDTPSFRAALCAATPAVDSTSLPARADFYFLGEGLAAVRRALAASHRLHVVVRDNLVLAAAYNTVTLTLCFAGVVTPVWAAILMPLSSVGVVSLTAYRLTRGGDPWRS
jgi:Cu2+-exporting ATPase